MPEINPRTLARQLFEAAVHAADPAAALENKLNTNPFPQPAIGGKTYLLAIGKGAPAMMRKALEHVTGPYEALVTCHHDNLETAGPVEVLRGGHPVPDAAGQAAAKRVVGFAQAATEPDVFITLVSGGASAILPAPPESVSLEDKMALHKALLGAGLDIVKMNLVRQQVSEIKGGGLLKAAAPARVTAYILSDVVGDDLRVVSSGPTVGPIGTASEAKAVCEQSGIWGALPSSVQTHLSRPDDAGEMPKADNHLIGSNKQSVDAMARAVPPGWQVIQSDAPLEGDVAEAATYVAEQISNAPTGTILLFGGETTVKLQGSGRGGRNQELALRVAKDLKAFGRPWVFLSGGTDGRDGPTDAAGGVVDEGSLTRIADAGFNVADRLADNDSYPVLKASGDLLLTDATGTNVADVQVAILP